MTAARDAFVSAARTLVGLTTPDPAYLSLVAPGDTGARQVEIGNESGCMLTRLGLEELVLDVPARGPYLDGSAPRLLEQRAGGVPWAPAGALRRATRDAPPQVGDGIWWGAAPGHVEHVDAAVTEAEGDSEGVIVYSVIAGGQRDEQRHECVKWLERRVAWTGGRWVDVGTGRAILAVLDCDILAERYPLRATPPA